MNGIFDRLRTSRLGKRLNGRDALATLLVVVAAGAFALIGVSSTGAASSSYYYCNGGSYTYCPPGPTTGTLIVIKHVVNDNNGTAVASDFTMSINLIAAQEGNVFPGQEAPGTTRTVTTGNYTVTETGPAGYGATFSAGCSGTIAAGETKTCTITNDDKTPEELLGELDDLVGSSDLDKGLEDKLEHEIADIGKALAKGKTGEACDHTNHFLKAVFDGAARKPAAVPIDDAQALVAAANNLELALGCFSPSDPRPGAEQDLLELMDTINSFGLPDGLANDLRNRARDAAKTLVDGKNACKQLSDLQAKIAKEATKGTLTGPQASQLTADVATIQAELGC